MSEDLFVNSSYVTSIGTYDYFELTDSNYGTNTSDELTSLGAHTIVAGDTIVINNNTDNSISIRYTGSAITGNTDTVDVVVSPGDLVRKYSGTTANNWSDITPAYLLAGTYDHIEFTDNTFGTDDAATNASVRDYTTLTSSDKLQVNNDTSFAVNVRYTGSTLTNATDTTNTSLPADSVYQKYSEIGANNWEDVTPICVHPDTKIRTVKGDIAIKDLRTGDKVYTVDWTDYSKPSRGPIVHKEGIVEIANIAVAHPATNLFIRIAPDAISPGVPSEELLIIEGHPIVINGKERQPNTMLGRKIQHVQLDQPVLTYNVCTKGRLAVIMNGVNVVTWDREEIADFIQRHAVQLSFL